MMGFSPSAMSFGSTPRRRSGGGDKDEPASQKDREPLLVGPGPSHSIEKEKKPSGLNLLFRKLSLRLRLFCGFVLLCLCIFIGFLILFRIPGIIDESPYRWNADYQRLSSPEYRRQLQLSRNSTIPRSEKIVLYTTVFGESAMNKRYVRLFLESSVRSGVDVVILGSPAPRHPLPPNVKYVPLTWDELADRLRDRVLNGKEPYWMRLNDNHFVKKWWYGSYKICDLRPLFAQMFPELVEGYDFWGHVDNDVILGDVRKMLGAKTLQNYDIITPIDNQYTLGLMMLYRNTPIVNELFFLTKRPINIFNSIFPRAFDEWGGPRRGFWLPYEDTMSGIVDLYHEQLGLQWYGGIQHFFDGSCFGNPADVPCCVCQLFPLPNGGQRLNLDCEGGKQLEAIACHYMVTKSKIEESLADDSHFETLLNQEAPKYLIDPLSGRFDVFEDVTA